MEGYTSSAEPEVYVGEDLFLLINGGAELYYEFGFEWVTVHDQSDGEGRSLHTEIYEFVNAAGAWGIFSANKTSDCDDAGLKMFSCISENHLIWQDGRYFILIHATGFEHAEEAEKVLLGFAGILKQGMQADNEPLKKLVELAPGNFDQHRIRYFQGNLGLSNIYSFHYQDIFSMDYGLSYKDRDEVFFAILTDGASIDSLASFFKESRKFNDVTVSNNILSCKDYKDNQLFFEKSGSWIIVQVGKADDPVGIFSTWTEHLSRK